MAQYTVTRACGHEETVTLYGPIKQREWRLANVEPDKLCSECYKAELEKQHQEENRKAKEAARSQELPELVGTEKQVAWAETLRQKVVAEIEKIIDEIDHIPAEKRNESEIDLFMKTVDIVLSKTSASWYIENRFRSAREILVEEAKAIQKQEKKAIAEAPETDAAQAKIEATVRPENPVTETVAEIRTHETFFEVAFPALRDDFREIMKKLRMEWNGRTWVRKTDSKTGPTTDRVAEAGHTLLAAGFIIRIYDPEIRARAISGEYEPECTRWIRRITSGEYDGWFSISWGRGEDFYAAARRLPGSKYHKPNVVVPPEQFDEVLDFAKLYGFRLSPGAQELAEQARQAKEAALVAKIDGKEKTALLAPATTPPVLDAPEGVEIDEALRDDN